jgi:hypothetical protein
MAGKFLPSHVTVAIDIHFVEKFNEFSGEFLLFLRLARKTVEHHFDELIEFLNGSVTRLSS